ncbi:MAG TPA: HEAT repeat domain-containing protein [Pyrinomonadaceae bacterium]|nr:HEAT repeat domain-containing protein [Pyrinomonadaceae bacterium]
MVLASLEENLSCSLPKVGRISDKLEVAAKHGGIRHIALAYTQDRGANCDTSVSHAESIPEVAEFRERCPNSRLSVSTVETFDEAFRFATEQVTSIREYLKHIQKQPLGITQDAVSMIDPYLTEIDSPPSMIGSSGPYAVDAVAEVGTKRRFAYRMLFRTLFERVGSYILVTAPPGYGKTLLASRIARELAAETEASLESGKATFEDASNKLVLLLEADAMLATVGPTNSSATPDDQTRRCLIESASATYKVGEPVFEFIVERALSHDTGSSVVIIIDALDRLSPEQRILLMPVLNAIANWPCVVILTTRQIPTEIPRSAAVHYELLPFSTAQIRRFITQRFSESRVQQRLIETIRRNLRLAHSATVPQVLSWLCDVFQGVALPSTRAALLGKIIDTISIPPYSTDEGRKDALRIVEHVAHEWWFSSDGIARVSRATVCKWIKEVMGDSLPLRVSRRLSEQLSDDEIARKWLTQFVEAGVLVPTSADDERLGWIHDSILEGFAAKFSARCADAPDLAKCLGDRRTRELLPLVAGYLKEPSQLLNKLLIGPDPFHRRLMLAAYCLSECDPSEQSPDLYLRDIATRIMDQLVLLLESPAASDRKRAADAIWWCAAWCDALIEKRLEALLLLPSSPKTAAVAAESLVAIARDKLHDSLFPYLTEGQARIRAHAIRRLGMLEDPRLPQLFTKLIDDSSPDVQIAAIDALAEIGTKDSIESLLTALESPSRWCRSAAANALSDLGDAVVDQLWQIVTGGAPQAREAAIEALALMELLWDDSDQLAQIQKDSSQAVRATFATVLGSAPKAFAMPHLLRLIADHNATVRLCALASLERLGNVDSAESVATMLNDPVELVRLRAAATLVLFGISSHEQRILERLNTGTLGKEVLAMLVHSRGPAAVRVLMQCVQSSSPLRIPAARALASLRIRESIPHLIRLLTDSDESARIAGIEALGVIGGSDAIEPLFLRLEDRSVLVSSKAAESLGRIGDVRAAVPLIRCLDSNDSKLRFNARQALSRLLPVSELLETTLSNGPPRGRVALNLYEALCQSVDLADFWDFGNVERTLAALTSSVTYGKSGPMPEYTFT